ncbi:FMN-dependent oxidoreductase, nitrilotriacetate monooxygenase family [Microbacterium sp. cf332]|nr:FMN-dependent oxidoreductase, nitrilotriacetate monooxygenase family [Microbacterium sp. cf332]
MSQRRMHLATAIANGFGSSPYAWTDPRVDPADWTDVRAWMRYAQIAERGKLDFIFFGDFLAQSQRAESHSPSQSLEPAVLATALALATERIGFVNTVSATFEEPYNIARVLKSLDVVSGGRIGWNAVTTSAPPAAANYGRDVVDRETRYALIDEVIQAVQALWGSWGEDAWIADKESRRFTDLSKIAPVNFRGGFVATRGPLEVPPSKQGQPIMSHSGAGPQSLALAGRHADILITEVFTIDEARQHRAIMRQAAAAAGRNPDAVKYLVGVQPSTADTGAAALARRGELVEPDVPQQVHYLGQLIGLRLGPADLDAPLSPEQLAIARAHPGDSRSYRALEIAREGWTVRQVLHHAVIDYHPAPIGRPEVIADHMQEWFDADAADGFWVTPDIHVDGMAAFVDGVVPILQQRGLFRDEYEGETLRDHLGIDRQYGPRYV